MTVIEINDLVRDARNGDIHARVSLCEHYITDYSLIRARHLLDGLYGNFLKLFWTQVKTQFPVLADDSALKGCAIDFQQSPDLVKMQALLKTFLQKAMAVSQGEYQRGAKMCQRVFAAIGTQLPQILATFFGEYATTTGTKKLIEPFIGNPSLNGFAVMIKAIVDFGKRTKETFNAQSMLRQVLGNYNDIETATDKDNLRKRISALASELGYTDELEFAISLWRANQGDSSAMIEVGNRYEMGRGVSQDEGTAEHWYMRATNAGNPLGDEVLEKLRNKQKTRKELELQREHFQTQSRIAEHESRERLRIEEERTDETKRHNSEMEELQRKQTIAQEERTAIIRKANIPPEEETVRVSFWYSTETELKHEVKRIPVSAYNAMITGGIPVITNFIKTEVEPSYTDIFDVSMKKKLH